MQQTKQFWPRVTKNSGVYGIDSKYPTECWLWTGSKNDRGYGTVWSTKLDTSIYAHRVAYTLTYKHPRRQCVLHKCDNRLCVRPDHLFLGSRRDNAADMDAKHRRVSVNKERHGRAKLSLREVEEIRAKHGLVGYTLLAREYGVSRAAIRNIIKRKVWA